MRNPLLIVTVIAALSACGSQVHVASPERSEPAIEVVGTAELKVVPDEFIVQATVRSSAAELSQATRDNHSRVGSVLSFLGKQGVERRYVVTDGFRVQPIVDHRAGKKTVGFEVFKNVTIILHRADKLEAVVEGVLASGADQIRDVQFRSKDVRKLVAEARVLATKNARKQARALAGELDQGLGKPLAITEESPRSGTDNFVYQASVPRAGDTFAVGKIRIGSAVRVKFALRPRS
ncbi:MAG: SIMPL domain-containing protein [Deltaproteobacteria bacterium]|nr:SIMPL domain-containing protein [Deltaproteobacteria bacterium]